MESCCAEEPKNRGEELLMRFNIDQTVGSIDTDGVEEFQALNELYDATLTNLRKKLDNLNEISV